MNTDMMILLFILVLIILFEGTPDIQDAIISHIMK